MNVIVDFLVRKLHSVPEDWRKALLATLAPDLLKEFGHALTRARASAASKHLPATSAATPDTSLNSVPPVAQQSRTSTASNFVAPVTTHITSESSKSIPVPPRPSVSKSTQAKSTSAQPPRASTSNRTTATNVAASVATPVSQAQASASTTQTVPSAPSIQPAKSLIGTSVHGQVAGGAYRPFSVPPPMNIPSADGKVTQYAYDPYLKQYTRMDIPNEHAMPSGPNAGTHYHNSVSATNDGQQPRALVPRGIPVSTGAPGTIVIPPATPPRREQSGAAPVARTPQQADRSRLAKDILRSLGIKPPPATAEEADKEVGVSPGNVPVTAEHQHETPSSRDLSVPLHETPQEISFLQPPSNFLMEQEQQPQTQTPQSPIKEAIADDTIMDDEPSSITPEKDTASPEFPLPATTLCPAPVSMDQEELARGVDGMSIATDVHRSEYSREDGPIDSPISFPDLDGTPPPVLEPAGISSPAPSFREQSREQSEDNKNEAVPLFLPSLSASPAPSDHSGVPLPPETDDEVLIVESILRGGSLSKRRVDSLDEDHVQTSLRSVKRKKGQRVYVLVPPPPPELRRAIKKRKLEDQGIVSGLEEEECTSLFQFG
jgi:hypothetical protein